MHGSRKAMSAFPLLPESTSFPQPNIEEERPVELHKAAVGLLSEANVSWNPVITANPAVWNGKVQKMISAGKDGVFFVLDFDRTITKCYLEDGSRALDCHDILASCPKITWSCKRMMAMLMDKYYPIEIDAKMSREEKIPHMVEWYKLVNGLLAAQGLTRDDVQIAVQQCMDFRLRTGVEELFQIAYTKGIPLIVVSAGLGNIVTEVIRQCIRKPSGAVGTHWENVQVLSNTLLWNHDGHHKGFSDPLIHMFNKSLQDAPPQIKRLIQGRHVGVLCGDGLGDLTMAHGHQTSTLLKVGFLNEKIDERLERYCGANAFDRVILNDGTFEPVLDAIRQL